MTNTIIQTGTSYRIFGESVTTHSELPVGTYRVTFSEISGHWLEKAPALHAGEETVYGSHERRLQRIINTYTRLEGSRSLGVLLSGDKGMGKSLMLRMLSHAVQDQLSLPVVLVDSNTPGIVTFLNTLGPCLIVFDEFEKVFSFDEDTDEQSQFLSLFDGTSTVSRLYAVSINDIEYVSDYMINRPGRFHYHIRFDYPGEDQIRQYLADKAPTLAADQVDKVVDFAAKVPLNYDHLRAIAFEMSLNGEDFHEVIGDLNIKNVHHQTFHVHAVFEDGITLEGTTRLDIFNPAARESLYVSGNAGSAYLHFRPSWAVATDEHGVLEIPADKVRVEETGDGFPALVRVELHRLGQSSFAF